MAPDDEKTTNAGLAAGEQQVLALIAEGKQFDEIAAQMGISDDQASQIISRLVKTFKVFGSADLVEQARQRGYLPPVGVSPPVEEPAPPAGEAPIPAAEAAPPPQEAPILAAEAVQPPEEPGPTVQEPELAADEQQALVLVAEGKQIGAIAAQMGISEDQASLVISRLVKIFGVFSSAGLVDQARQRGYLPPVEASPPAAEPSLPPAETPIPAAEAAPPPEEAPIPAAEPSPLPEEAPILAAEAAPPPEEVPIPAQEPAPAAGQRRGRWHPLLIALLNLTGLGIGYLFLKRPLRWLLHAAVTAGLLAAAWYTNAARYPLPWLIGLGAWLAWMVVDGWLAARRQEWSARRPWLPAAAAVALIGLVAAGLWFYQDLCAREFLLGMIDYQQGSCGAAFDRLGLVGSACELTFSSNVPVAEDKCAECVFLRGAVDARQAGRFDEAISGYQAYLAAYPGGDLAAHATDNAAAAYGEWAATLRTSADFQAAVDTYEAGRSAYPAAPASQRAPDLAAETYGEWAAQLLGEGQFDQAVAKYETILADYPGTPAGAQAAAQAAETYAGWAGQLLGEGQFDQAVARYETILADYPDTPAAAQAAAQAAGAYAGWAGQLHQQGDYEAAIARYEAILAAYPDTPAGAEAPALAAQTHADWAALLRDKGDYEAAVANYQAILDRYPTTPPAEHAPDQAAGAYDDWAGLLHRQADYALAAEKYQIILDRYPASQPAPGARESLALTLYDWAEALRAGRDYSAAVERYQTILSDFSASQVISRSVEGLAWTTYDWAASLQAQRQYGPAMDRYEQILADPRLSAVVTATADAALDAGLVWTAALSATQDYGDAVAAGLRTQAVAGPERLAEAGSLLARVYWAWGNDYVAARSYSSAIDKYNLVLDDPALKAHASGVAEAAASAYYAWGQSQGATDGALSAYADLRQRFPKSKWASQAAEAAATIYLGRADAQRQAGKYSDAISAYDRIIKDYPNTKAAGQAKTNRAKAEATWRSGYATKLLAAVTTAQEGADKLSGIYTTLSGIFGTVFCSTISAVKFGDTQLTIPDRFPSLQTAYRNYRDALSLLAEAKKILTDKCPGSATSTMLSNGKAKISAAKSKLNQAKQAAEAAK